MEWDLKDMNVFQHISIEFQLWHIFNIISKISEELPHLENLSFTNMIHLFIVVSWLHDSNIFSQSKNEESLTSFKFGTYTF